MQVNLVCNATAKIFSIHLDQAVVVCNLKFLIQFGLVLLISVLEITHKLNLQPKSVVFIISGKKLQCILQMKTDDMKDISL